MRSTDLTQDGFMNWFPLNLNQQHRLLNRTPTKRGAFAVRSLQDYPRVRGQSDIYSLGVGANSIKGLYTRVEQMFSPGRSQTTNNNILDEMRTRLLEISFEKPMQIMQKRLSPQY